MVSEFAEDSANSILPQPRAFFVDDDGTPLSWFTIFEFSFNKNHNSSTMAKYLLSNLPSELLQKLGSSAVKCLNSSQPYEELKDVIFSHYSPSRSEIFKKYFQPQTLGNTSASKFLSRTIAELNSLQPGSPPNPELVKELFLSAMPAHIRPILLSSDKSDPTDLAKIADRVLQESTNSSSTNIQSNDLCSTVEELSKQVSLLTTLLTQNSADSSYVNRTDSRSLIRRSSQRKNFLLCSYHNQFANKAKKCCIGCGWSKSDSDSILRDPVCVYHNRFGSKAIRCLQGCTFSKNE
jgi:hypothetical protein